jgi:hypothetical protein
MASGRRSKRLWLWAAVAVVLIAAAGLWWNSDNQKDRRVWNRFLAQLTEANVTKVELVSAGGGKATIRPADKAAFLTELRAAKFERSNRQGFGPTPAGSLVLTFADGTAETIGVWGSTTYELSPRRLDPKTQFLITSDTLGIWLRNHLQGPAIGEAPAGFSAPGASLLA